MKTLRTSQLSLSLLLLLSLLSVMSALHAQDSADNNDANNGEKDTWHHFQNLVDTIEHVKQDLRQARDHLMQTRHDDERKAAQEEVSRLSNELASLQLAWEMWATGGVDLQLFNPQADTEKFDWRDELESVFEPIVVEMRRITERPRKIERLRSEQMYFQRRLSAADIALENINDFLGGAPTPALIQEFSSLKERWQSRRDRLQSRLDVINFELDELMSPTSITSAEALDGLKQLFSGRILNLLLALLAASLAYTVLWQVNRIYTRRLMRNGRSPSFITRVTHLLLVIAGSVLALLAGMAVLYSRGDWILLGLLLILLVALAISLQRHLPAYLAEAKLLLNIGAVREGERVIYNGLPWRIKALRVFAHLENPLLSGGQLRLPLTELQNLVSRQDDEQEPWFPSRLYDYVVLNDGTYGCVLLQTPEIVQLKVLGSLSTYSTRSFVDMSPRNLSLNGFSVVTRFGIDYRYQTQVHEIRAIFEQEIEEGLRQQSVGQHMQTFSLEFAEAAASSLDFLIVAGFQSPAAENYLKLQRLIQIQIVDSCNRHGWEIPFNELNVHISNNED